MKAEHTEQASHGFFRIQEALPKITPETLGNIGPFTIANTTTTILLILVIALYVSYLFKKPKERPSFFQNVVEMIYESIASLVVSIVGDKIRAKKIAPYIASILSFIAIANLLPLFPGLLALSVSSPSGHEVSLFRGATTDFNTTFSIALAVVLSVQLFGMKEQGVFGYLSHFIQVKQVIKGFRKSFGDGMIAIVGFFVGLIEIIGEIAKSISLSLRLFGNMFAHEVLSVILLGAFAYILPAVWMGMGVLVGIVQAIVFSSLITVYFSLVLKKENDAH